MQQELTTWTNQPSPERRVEIPKPDGKGVRLLGIPTVRDRVVQTTLKLLLEPIFDPHFSPNSYGFRPGRSQHQPCEPCAGEGQQIYPQRLTMAVPPGVADGARFSFSVSPARGPRTRVDVRVAVLV